MYCVAKYALDIPEYGLYIIRYHSFYPWHSPPEDQTRGYVTLASDKDWKFLPLLKMFSKGDLYSKRPDLPAVDILEKRYNDLIEKYRKKDTKALPEKTEKTKEVEQRIVKEVKEK